MLQNLVIDFFGGMGWQDLPMIIAALAFVQLFSIVMLRVDQPKITTSIYSLCLFAVGIYALVFVFRYFPILIIVWIPIVLLLKSKLDVNMFGTMNVVFSVALVSFIAGTGYLILAMLISFFLLLAKWTTMKFGS